LSRVAPFLTLSESYVEQAFTRMNQFGPDATPAGAPPRAATTLLKAVARSIVPSRADFCFIHLADGEHLRCVATAHATRAGQRIVSELGRVHRIRRNDPESTVAQVVRSGRPRVRSDIPVDAGPHRAPRISDVHRQLRPRSALVVPLLLGSTVVGALTLGYADSDRRYGSHHLAGAKRLAKRIAGHLTHGYRTAGSATAFARSASASTRRVPLRARV
jgi:GAF domain-containing protein